MILVNLSEIVAGGKLNLGAGPSGGKSPGECKGEVRFSKLKYQK